MNKSELETAALQLKALLLALSAVDTDNKEALVDLPHALGIASTIAETIYCEIVNR